MKTLILMRHAKSSWKDTSLPDYDRPLNKRGRRDAPLMGRRLAARDSIPDLMVSSPAARAMATAEAIAGEIDYPWAEIVGDERLYGADELELLEVISRLDDQLQSVLLVGHNPGLSDLANDLSPDPIGNLPTCGIVEMTFGTNRWALIGEIVATRASFDYPKRRWA